MNAPAEPRPLPEALRARRGLRIAVVGAGVSGLVAAHLLAREHEVTVYEAGAAPGGHARTVDVDDGGRALAVDTGFVVFNDHTYPRFRRLLDGLGVAARPTDMSFGVRCERTGIEYGGTSLDALFAQRRNALRPTHLRMVRDILRFYREAGELLATPDDGPTLGAYLRDRGYSEAFVGRHIVPMAAAVWSSSEGAIDAFPARFLVEFFRNHGFLRVSDRPQWFTVEGGARRYVARIAALLGARLRTSTPVACVRRAADHVDVVPRTGGAERHDVCVLALHADQALAVLADASAAEREILGALPYARNDAQLHSDERLLPRARRARSSWNYHRLREDGPAVAVTYDMTRLQRLPTPTRHLVSLNRADAVDPASVRDATTFHHPQYTPRGVAAQRRRAEIDGVARTFYCGAYWGYGFHEDGVRSALDVTRRFGLDLP